MNINILIKYWNEVKFLFLEMAPYLMLGFLISGLLYIIISKETISIAFTALNFIKSYFAFSLGNNSTKLQGL